MNFHKKTLRSDLFIINETDDDNTGIFHVFELQIGMNEFDHRSFLSLLLKQ